MKSVQLLPTDLLKGLSQIPIVVDTCDYYPSFRDGVIQDIEGGLTESEWVVQQLRRPVVKAFNNIMAPSLANGGLPKGRGQYSAARRGRRWISQSASNQTP